MATERVVYEADTARLMSAIQQVVDKEVELRQGIKKTKKETAETSDAFTGLGKNAIGQLVGMAGGVASVSGGFALLGQHVSHFREELNAAGEQLKKISLELTGIAGGRGDLANLPQLSEFIKRNAPGGVSQKEAIKAYGAVGGALPNAEFAQVLDLSKKAMEAKAAGVPDLAEFGTVLGGLAKHMPGKSADDLADLAKMVTEKTGKYGGKFGEGGLKVMSQWQALGLGDAEEGLAYVLASFDAEQGSEAALALVTKLAEQKEVEKLTRREERRLTAAQLQQRAFYGANAAERLRMLQGDAAMRQTIFGSQAGPVEAMLARDPAAIRAALEEAQRTNLFEQSKTLVQADPDAKAALASETIDATLERVKVDKYGAAGLTDSDILKMLDTVLAERSWLFRKAVKTQYDWSRALGLTPQQALRGMEGTAIRGMWGGILSTKFGFGLTQHERELVETGMDNPEAFSRGMDVKTGGTQGTVIQNQYNNSPIIQFNQNGPVQQRPPLAGEMGGNVYN